ncbi:MAG TPA: hypothetical protein VMV86_06795, partial [Methanosarcinales archaeon]|nr:hypothetical protein [Methanosarcinales archaeon]
AVPALKGGEIGKRFSTLAAHGFVTTEGDLQDRVEAGVYRAAYSMTPFIAQHWGATGIKSIAIDTALNTFLTSPTYIKAYNKAKETGNYAQFVSDVIPQFVMDIGMALTTTGYPEAHRAAKIKDYLKTTARSIDMSYKDLDAIVKSFEKAQTPKTALQKQALVKQEARLQALMQKDNANIELEKLAADEKNSPINKLIQQAEDNPAIPNIQDKINNIAMELSTNQQKARVHIRAKELGLLTPKDKEKAVYQKYMEALVGEKSTKNMNQGQIKMVIDNLDKMDIQTSTQLAKTKVHKLTPELLRFVTGLGELKDIGAVAKFRNPYEVFNAIGLLRQVYMPAEAAEVALYDDEMVYRTEVKKLLKQEGIAKESRQKVFDAIENPKLITELTKIEEKYRGRAYRAETHIPEHGAEIISKMKTAQEKIDYDASTTGNPIFKEAGNLAKNLGIDLKKVPIEELTWVAPDLKTAEKYGEAKEIKLTKDTIILAKDEKGGSLILKNAEKYKEEFYRDVTDLNPSETKLRNFAVKFFDDWANKLKLPPEKRIDKYVTHIFEKALNDMTDKGYIDPDILRAFEFGAIPKTIKNPFIQNERTGQEYLLKRDVIEAMNVYESYALRTFHYEPLHKKMDIYNKFLPELSRKYLSNFAGRLTNRPLEIDKGMNNDIREITKAIAESPLANKPVFKKLLPLLKNQSRGNIAGTAAYYYTGILYETALGLRPDSAIRNLGQGTLTIAESGLGNYIKGINFLTTKEGKDALHKSLVYKSRKYAYLPSQGGYIPQNIMGNLKNAMMYMFKSADKFNVSSAFATGYQEARSLGLPDPIAIERGDEVARKTQYMYTKMAAPEFTMTVPGKVLGVFTSWPRNWLELTRHWVRGDVSEVYLNYEKQTGKKVYKEDWLNRHRSAMMYAAIYALSMYIEQKTDIQATQYTGFKTIETIPRYLAGNIAGLRLPLAVSQIAVGSALRDRTMLTAGLKGVNPTTWFNVLKKLDDISSGKKDWLDMFFYRNKKQFRLR